MEIKQINSTIKSRAAVAFAPNQPLQIVEIDVEMPRKGEVLIRNTHTGVCHTDAFTLSGSDPEGVFPVVLGHEGADVVIHSGTKYIAGHNDALVGLIVAKGQELCDRIAYIQNGAGAVLSPFDSWLTIRGMKTLSLRMKRHQENAQAIAEFLKAQPQVESVLYPNKGGMLSFRLQDEAWVNTFLKSIKLITFAESLGGTESFITYPATQTHMDIPESERVARGITNTLLRFSVGIEDVEDIKADLLQAFANLK